MWAASWRRCRIRGFVPDFGRPQREQRFPRAALVREEKVVVVFGFLGIIFLLLLLVVVLEVSLMMVLVVVTRS